MPTPAPVNGYCSLADLRSTPALNFDAAYTTDDQLLCDLITATSRAIDKQCGRYFYKSTASETRYFTTPNTTRVFVGDFISITSLSTDTLSGDRTYPFIWAATDYDLYPYDAATTSEPEPYRFIDTTLRGQYLFPAGIPKAVKLDAVYGWAAVPELINAACMIWTERNYKRLSTPLGSASMSALGAVSVRVPPPDPDVEQMLANYRLVAV